MSIPLLTDERCIVCSGRIWADEDARRVPLVSCVLWVCQNCKDRLDTAREQSDAERAASIKRNGGEP